MLKRSGSRYFLVAIMLLASVNIFCGSEPEVVTQAVEVPEEAAAEAEEEEEAEAEPAAEEEAEAERRAEEEAEAERIAEEEAEAARRAEEERIVEEEAEAERIAEEEAEAERRAEEEAEAERRAEEEAEAERRAEEEAEAERRAEEEAEAARRAEEEAEAARRAEEAAEATRRAEEEARKAAEAAEATRIALTREVENQLACAIDLVNSELLALNIGTELIQTKNECWYRVAVPAGNALMTIALGAYAGAFDLYLDSGSTNSPGDVINSQNRLNFRGPIEENQVFAYSQPHGDYTIAVAPSNQQGTFDLLVSAVGGANPLLELSEAGECSGDPCRAMYYSFSGFQIPGSVHIGSEFGDRVIFPFEVGCPGVINVQAAWSGTAEVMALILNGPGMVNAYERIDGYTPLSVQHQVTSADVQDGARWYVTLTNFSEGEADGYVQIEYPSCEGGGPVSGIDSYVGVWRNSDPDTGSWTMIEITSQGDTLFAHIWGACSPTDCDAGIISAPYQGSPVTMPMASDWVERQFTLALEGDTLHVTTFSHYTDNSGRADRTSDDYFSLGG